MVTSPEVVGVDGCKGGWVVASRVGVIVVPRLQLDRTVITGVDMPIGLAANGRRACDFKARSFLGARRSTVFPAPPRACINDLTHADANATARRVTGKGLSIQTFHLFVKIRELDDQVAPTDDDSVIEVHPECAFATMCDDNPLPSKHTLEGRNQRVALIEAEFGELPPTPQGAQLDDLLDAFAVLWSTERFARGVHRTFGDGARDERDLPMRIVC